LFAPGWRGPLCGFVFRADCFAHGECKIFHLVRGSTPTALADTSTRLLIWPTSKGSRFVISAVVFRGKLRPSLGMTASAATACAELDTDAAENLPARLFVPLGVRMTGNERWPAVSQSPARCGA
jgi:hypothetical protein